MDNLMGKLAEKLSAQEMIKANNAAEAAHREQMELQNKQYEEELDVLRQNAKRMESLITDIEDALADIKTQGKDTDCASKDLDIAIEELKKDIEERFAQSDEATHDVGVRIYRNVQASVAEEQNKQLEEIRSDFNKQMDSIRGEFQVMLRQMESLQMDAGDKTKPILPFVVLTFLVSVANLILFILRIIGLV